MCHIYAINRVIILLRLVHVVKGPSQTKINFAVLLKLIMIWAIKQYSLAINSKNGQNALT